MVEPNPVVRVLSPRLHLQGYMPALNGLAIITILLLYFVGATQPTNWIEHVTVGVTWP